MLWPMAGGMQRYQAKSVREAKAYRAVQVGVVGSTAFVVTTLLAIVGAIGDTLPVLFLIVAILSAVRFVTVTGMRNRRR
jgi:hypothetical protein